MTDYTTVPVKFSELRNDDEVIATIGESTVRGKIVSTAADAWGNISVKLRPKGVKPPGGLLHVWPDSDWVFKIVRRRKTKVEAVQALPIGTVFRLDVGAGETAEFAYTKVSETEFVQFHAERTFNSSFAKVAISYFGISAAALGSGFAHEDYITIEENK